LLPVGERAKELLPSVLLTLTSIVQALSLEVLWSSAREASHLWHPGPLRLAGWLQVAAVFLTIVLVWIYYAQLVMRFRWVPLVRDSIVPFGFGLGQFALASLLAPGQLGSWCFVVAGLFAFAIAASVSAFRTAARDHDNDWYFAAFPWTGWGRFVPGATAIALFSGAGLLARRAAAGSGSALVAVAIVNGVLVWQIGLQRRYWNRSVLAPRAEP